MLRTILDILTSKYMELVIGCLMFFSAAYEIYESIHNFSHSLGGHHGIAIFGLITALRALSELLHGARLVAEEQTQSSIKKQPKKVE